MGFYRPLFTIDIEHGYFADGQWRELEFEPDFETSRMANLPSLAIKQTANGVMACVDEEKREPLRMLAAERGGKLRFRFMARAKDRSFANYTAYAPGGGSVVPCFDNLEKEEQPGAKTRLSREQLASEADYREIDTLIAEGTLDVKGKLAPPDFIVTIFIEPDGKQGFAPREYRIGFGARQSFWKYYLLGDMNRGDSFVVDLEKRVEFVPCDEAILAGNRPARVFRSNQTLPLLERSEYRFQLKERGANGEKVLIKRLPLASAARLGSEVIDGRNELVLENFVQY